MRQLAVLLLTFSVLVSQIEPKSQACFLDFTGFTGKQARRLALSLQYNGAKPDDHIPQFAAIALEHVEYIEKGLKDPASVSESPKAEEALGKLRNLKNEVNQRILDEKVTYRWWVVFNFRLAAISSFGLGNVSFLHANPAASSFFEKLISASDSHEDALKALSQMPVFFGIEADLNTFLEEFPNRVFIPSMVKFELADFNERRSSGAYFLGLVNAFSMADGKKLNPAEFLFHDLLHALFSKDKPGDWQSKVYARHAKTLNEDKRAVLDVVYFLWDHESEIQNLFETDYSGSFGFGPGVKFCEGCSQDSILAFLPSEIVAQGEIASVAWMNEAIKETRAFFFEHQPKENK